MVNLIRRTKIHHEAARDTAAAGRVTDITAASLDQLQDRLKVRTFQPKGSLLGLSSGSKKPVLTPLK
jgi:hypothetical protein